MNVTFPEEYQAAELAGKAAVFKIKLHEVKYKELPALDDELAKDVLRVRHAGRVQGLPSARTMQEQLRQAGRSGC